MLQLLLALNPVSLILVTGAGQTCLGVIDDRQLNHICSQRLLILVSMSAFQCLRGDLLCLHLRQSLDVLSFYNLDGFLLVCGHFQQFFLSLLFDDARLLLDGANIRLILQLRHYLLIISLKVEHFLIFRIPNFEHGILLLLDLSLQVNIVLRSMHQDISDVLW